jgi:hypothetical protein
MQSEAAKVREVERVEQRGSSDERHDLRTHTATEDEDPRMAALQNWGVNLQDRSAKKNWTKPKILSDEPRDFTVWPMQEAS